MGEMLKLPCADSVSPMVLSGQLGTVQRAKMNDDKQGITSKLANVNAEEKKFRICQCCVQFI